MSENGAESLKIEERASMLTIAPVGPAYQGHVNAARVQGLTVENQAVAVRDSSVAVQFFNRKCTKRGPWKQELVFYRDGICKLTPEWKRRIGMFGEYVQRIDTLLNYPHLAVYCMS
jgi:hypothetical protein